MIDMLAHMVGLYRNGWNFVAIVLLCIVAAICYGIAHDSITVRMSREYFTVLHPQLLDDDAPAWQLALLWGTIATWWVGLILGTIVAFTANWGVSRPVMKAARLVKPVATLLVAMAVCAAIAGCIGYAVASGSPDMFPRLTRILPGEVIVPTIAVAFAHNASYLSGGIGGIVLAIWCWRKRGQRPDGISPS
ncbi:MAG: hypothetical protein ACAI35_27315 [Candidatus Methylacidiphilales bacterium]|nr:hypothetical protein [Candidatus Methylacidiphilales bacterium]